MWYSLIFKLNPSGGQPIYVQLIRQIQHAIAIGVLQAGDAMPSIRTLSEQLAISHNTVAKAYSELERVGSLELRHGSGAFVSAAGVVNSRNETLQWAQERIGQLIGDLREKGITEEEIQRLFEGQLFFDAPAGVKR